LEVLPPETGIEAGTKIAIELGKASPEVAVDPHVFARIELAAPSQKIKVGWIENVVETDISHLDLDLEVAVQNAPYPNPEERELLLLQ
jgi:hypothetical protein